MTDSFDAAGSCVAPHHAHLPFDCNGAAVRAQCRSLGTVVTITGVVDATNVDQVSEYSKRFILPDKPFVLECSVLNWFPAPAGRLLYRVDIVSSAAVP